MTSAFLQYQFSKIHYICFGKGEQILFAFHGYNENANSLLVLERSLGEKYTVIALDIPYHGETVWNEAAFFSTHDFILIMKQLIEEKHVKRFSVLGFSMGGKCALYTVKTFAQQIDELFLLASDGIKTNKIYNVAVYPKWGRELFKTTIRHPRWFFTFISGARKLRIISPWLHKFTYNHMDTKEKRQRLYNTWVSMATFNPDIKLVKEEINHYSIRTILFFGIRDEVIPVRVGEYFAEGLNNCKLIVLERGHYFIDDRLNPFITENINQ